MSEAVEVARIRFRFVCQPGCINCCQRPGDVFLTPDDAERIAEWLELTPAEFERRFCDRDADGALHLTNPTSDGCHFLLEDGCSIHDVKPLQCRTFPYWPENVKSRGSWKRVGRYCPGIGVGEIVPVETVIASARACAEAFPDIE